MLMELGTAIKAGKDGFQFVRDLRGAIQREEVKPTEVADRLLQIQQLLLELQAALSGALDENRELRRQLDDKADKKAVAADMVWELDGHFFVKNSERALGLIPYCPTCWKSNGKDVPLAATCTPGFFRCAIHDTPFNTSGRLRQAQREEEEQELRFRRENQISPV